VNYVLLAYLVCLFSQELRQAHWATHESKFNHILCSNSYAQLRATFAEYQTVAHHSIQETFAREMYANADMLTGMVTFGKWVSYRIIIYYLFLP